MWINDDLGRQHERLLLVYPPDSDPFCHLFLLIGAGWTKETVLEVLLAPGKRSYLTDMASHH